MIKSNIIKSVPYPDEFSDEDKLQYDLLYSQAKIIHPDVEKENPFIIHISIIAYIRGQKGMACDFTDEELEEVKNSYKLNTNNFECNVADDHYIYDKEKNPIFFPSTLTISSDDIKKPSVIIESN